MKRFDLYYDREGNKMVLSVETDDELEAIDAIARFIMTARKAKRPIKFISITHVPKE